MRPAPREESERSMAKKVRRPHEEEEAAFDFPEFDEKSFLAKESELGYALALGVVFALVAGVLSWLATATGVPWFVPFPLGFVYLGVSYAGIARLRPRSGTFTRGDWAGLLAVQFFTWLAVWFALVNVT